MNKIETALTHALFKHLHHNIDRVIDFEAIEELNAYVSETRPNDLVIGPGDDAAVFRMPGMEGMFVAKMESHCSPAVPRPYDAAATAASGAMRDIVAMGARPLFMLDFIGTRPMHQKVLVGPCGFKEKCTCGKCVEMTSRERVDLIVKGILDMCHAMNVMIIGGGFSSSFSDIVPAIVGTIIGKLISKDPLTKPAKSVGDKLILIGITNNDGNDTLFRAGLVDTMKPAIALFKEERQVMEASLDAIRTNNIKAMSDLGAAGIGAAVCESARYGRLGAKVDLSLVPTKTALTPEEILICETQGRMLLQVAPEDVNSVIPIDPKAVDAVIIGEITDDDKEIFTYHDKVIATIPNSLAQQFYGQKKN